MTSSSLAAAALFLALAWNTAAVAFSGRAAAERQQSGATVLDGVYTTEQAARGRIRYAKSCSECHQDMLMGTDTFPALAGEDFVMRWEERKVLDLFKKITTQMPPDGLLVLRDDEWLEIVAFVLESNRYPSGPDPLVPGPALAKIEFVKPK